MLTVGLEIGRSRQHVQVVNESTGNTDFLVVGASDPYVLDNDTITGVVFNNVTYTTDIHGQALTRALLSSGPVCLQEPVLLVETLSLGETTEVEKGIWIFDAEASHPILTPVWLLDGTSTFAATNTYVPVAEGEVSVQERVTQPSLGSRIALSNAVPAEA